MNAILLFDPSRIQASSHLSHDDAIGNDADLLLGQAEYPHQFLLHQTGGDNQQAGLIAAQPFSMGDLLGDAIAEVIAIPSPFSAVHGQQEGQAIVALDPS